MADSTAEPGQASASGGVPVWERAWTVDEMRKSADDWSLAGDAGMLQYLQDFSQRIISQTHDIQEQVNGLVHESKLTGIRVQNAFNDFIMLANTQFVENRVYDEDVNTETEEKTEKKEEKEKTREEREAALIPKIKEAMLLGFNVIDTAFETLDVNDVNSDSEEEDESPYKTDTILEPKDPYLSRPLPYLIGSQAFMTDDDVGLTDVPSEGEESDHGSISESESESDTEPVTQQQKPPSRRPTVLDSSDSGSSDEETETESESDLFGAKDEDSDVSLVSDDEEEEPKKSETSNFASELAAKLGATENNDKVEKKEKKQTEAKKERASSKSKQTVKPPPEDDDEDLFGPPPMEDDDSPFGRKGGLFSSGGGLFDDDDNEGGGLFDDVVPQKPPPTVVPDKQEDKEPPKEDQLPEPARPRTKSGRKVPVGGISIFAGGDDDLFGGKNKKQDSESEDEVVEEPEKSQKPAKVTAPLTGGGGLFDDDDDDLFAAATTAPATKVAPRKEVAPSVDLFGDEDEDGDLFAAAPPVKKQPPKEESKPQKKLPAGAVSMFGGNPNPLAAALKAQRPPSDKEESDEDWEEDDKASQSSSRSGTSSSISGIKPSLQPGGIKKSASPSLSNNSLFAEEPESDFTATKPKPAVSVSKSKAAPSSGKGLFADDSDEEDLFATATKPKSSQLENKPKPQKSGLFLDDEEDDGGLFGAAPKAKKQEPISKAKPKAAGGMFDDDLFAEPSKQEPPPLDTKPQKSQDSSHPHGGTTLSLFDDGDDNDNDLFGGRAPPKLKPPVKQPMTLDTKGAKPRTRSLFADDDVLFGGAEEDPAVDLFGADSPLSPSEESKPFPPSAQKSTTKVTPDTVTEAPPKDKVQLKGATVGASSTDLFNDDDGDETDLFSTPSNPLSQPAGKMDTKVEVKGATTSESSTDKPATLAAQGKKKPIGGVSMFGGMDPSMLKNRAGSQGKDSETKPTPPELPESDVAEDEAPMSAVKRQVKPPPTTKPKPKHASNTSVGKLQTNLMINPSALLPGATPPSKEPQPTPVGFDEPVKANTLSNVQKDRVKGQSRRRPPTRKSRIITSEDVTDAGISPPISDVPSTAPAAAPMPAAARVPAVPPTDTSRTSAPNADLFADAETDIFSTSRREPTVSGVRAPSRVKESPPDDDDLFSDSNFAGAIPTSTSDIFSNNITQPKQYSKVKGPLDKRLADDLIPNDTKKTEKKPVVEDDDDLFGSAPATVPSTSSKSKTVKPVILDDDEDDDDIFTSAAARPPPLPTGPDDFDDDEDDIFGVSSLAVKSMSKPLVDNDDDIFFSSQEKKAPPPVLDEDDIFSTASVPKPTKTKTPLPFEDDEDDLFGSTKPPSSAPKKQSNVPSKSAPSLDDNIFADLPPAKSREKKIKKKEAKSIFQDDDDDIFAEASSKTKTKKSSTNKKKPAATNIFGNNDDAGDIFDDPLNAMKH